MKALKKTFDCLGSCVSKLESLANKSNLERIYDIWASFYADVNRVDIDICNRELGPLEISSSCDFLIENLSAIKSYSEHEFALRSSLHF